MMTQIGSRNRTAAKVAQDGAGAARGGSGARRPPPLPAILVGLVVAGVLCAAAGTSLGQHCRLHYTEAFQQVTVNNLAGRSQAEIKQQIDDLFGPRQEVCGEKSYKFFLTELGNYTSEALRKKGAEQEARLLAAREIMTRFPLRVRFNSGTNPASGLKQLRADLTVVGTEVGLKPPVQAMLEILAKVTPPTSAAQPMPADDDAVPIVVPRVPLPAWAVISLYEIRDHAKRKENGAIINKAELILDWMAHINAGARPGDLQVSPTPPAAPAKPAGTR